MKILAKTPAKAVTWNTPENFTSSEDIVRPSELRTLIASPTEKGLDAAPHHRRCAEEHPFSGFHT
jgi:hypothetical protein